MMAWLAICGISILHSAFGSSPGFQDDGRGGLPVSYSPARTASIPATACSTTSPGITGSGQM